MSQWDDEYDLVIVGSGGGSVSAALAAKTLRHTSLIIEKQDKFGGSTGFSGGVWWIPNNPLMARDGIVDSYQRARQYLDAAVGEETLGSSSARREAFLKQGPQVVTFLESYGMRFQRVAYWPDYYDNLPGGEKTSRSLVAPLFNCRELGEWEAKLSMYKGLSMPVNSDEVPVMMLFKRTWAGKIMGLRMLARQLKEKLLGQKIVGTGAAIQGRLLQIALRENVPIWLNSPVADLVLEGGRVTGVIVQRDGQLTRVRARNGVLINVGGFSRNLEMRRQYQRPPVSDVWTNANPGDTGEIIRAAMAAGAASECMDEAWWVVTSLGPGETLPEGAVAADGTMIPFMHHLDLAKPHLILVDQMGQRIANESGAYMEIGQRIYSRQQETGKAVPAWAVMDSHHRDNYPWATGMPGATPKQWLESGYMKKADTLEVLAKLCNIDTDGLCSTVQRFNDFAARGVDEDYGRGGREFDRRNGDPTVKPNPALGAIAKPPFYACAIYPGDVGTAGGLVCDERARVLQQDGKPIDGLYATGNSTSSVVGRCYPGAGASIGASTIFGYIAAQHACREASTVATSKSEAAV